MGSKQVSMLFHQNYKISLEYKKRELHVPLYKKCYHLKHKYYNQQNPNPLNELKCNFDSKIN